MNNTYQPVNPNDVVDIKMRQINFFYQVIDLSFPARNANFFDELKEATDFLKEKYKEKKIRIEDKNYVNMSPRDKKQVKEDLSDMLLEV